MNAQPDAARCALGSRWRGVSGNVMEVVEVDGDRVRIAYLDDPDDSCWEDAADVIRSFTEMPENPQPEPEDENGWTDPEARLFECSQCHRVKPCLWVPDPFIAEIYPEDDPQPDWWCGGCHYERYLDT